MKGTQDTICSGGKRYNTHLKREEDPLVWKITPYETHLVLEQKNNTGTRDKNERERKRKWPENFFQKLAYRKKKKKERNDSVTAGRGGFLL